MGSFHAEPGVLAPGRWARPGGKRGKYRRSPESLALTSLRIFSGVPVMVNRVGGECKPLNKSAMAGHECLLLEWDALRCGVMRCDSRKEVGVI